AKSPVASRSSAAHSSVPAAGAQHVAAGRSPAGKKIAAAASALILLGLAGAVYILTRGSTSPERPFNSGRAAVTPPSVDEHGKNEPPGHTAEIPGRSGAESDNPARRETAAPRPLQEQPLPASEVTTGKDVTGGSCVGVTVTRGDGSPGSGFLLTLLD